MPRGLPLVKIRNGWKTRTEMQVGVQVEAVFISATDYSPMKSNRVACTAPASWSQRGPVHVLGLWTLGAGPAGPKPVA